MLESSGNWGKDSGQEICETHGNSDSPGRVGRPNTTLEVWLSNTYACGLLKSLLSILTPYVIVRIRVSCVCRPSSMSTVL